MLTHLSVAACGQTSSPSPPSHAPPDPPPEVSSESVWHQAPALSPSKLGHLQSAHGHLADDNTKHANNKSSSMTFW